MASSVDASDLIRLVADGAQLVEVLPQPEYLEEHLPGAMNLPLKTLTATLARERLDPRRAVIVYCWDAL
jgi:rhodanese-related sulfurtransferase